MSAKSEERETATTSAQQALEIAIMRAGAKPAPGWLQCELCEHPGTSPNKRLIVVHSRHEHDPSSEIGALVLLCAECWELVTEQIDEAEWKRRTSVG